LGSINNLVLTNYLEFRWYADGQPRGAASLGTLGTDGKIKSHKVGITEVAQLLTAFLEHPPQQVATPKELAKQMARLAHRIRELVVQAF